MKLFVAAAFMLWLSVAAVAHPFIRDNKAMAQDCRHIAQEVKAIEKKQKSRAYSKLQRQLKERMNKWERAWLKHKCPRYGPANLSKR